MRVRKGRGEVGEVTGACGLRAPHGKMSACCSWHFCAHYSRYRLGVQDAALSRRKPGFESRYRYQIFLNFKSSGLRRMQRVCAKERMIEPPLLCCALSDCG